MKKDNATQTNNPILNIVSPQSLNYGYKDIEISGYKARGYGITKYPSQLPYGWLGKITNFESTVASISEWL